MATAGSVVSGILASACCIGPLVLGLMGISGAAFARRFEPFRPYLLVVTYALLGGAFYLTYRPPAACGPGEACATKTTLKIEGMTCGGCVAAVKLQLGKTDGVAAYEVSLEKGEAEVTYDPAKTEPKKIAESVSKTGFTASVKETDGSRKGTSKVKAPEPTVKNVRLDPWEPVDAAFKG